MRSRLLTNILLVCIAVGVFAYLGWTIRRDSAAGTAAQFAAERLHQNQMAQERVAIWNVATDQEIVGRLEDYLAQKTGRNSVTLDHVYVRDYRVGDVRWEGGRDAVVSGFLDTSGQADDSPVFYLTWKRKMRLNDSGQWIPDSANFQYIQRPPKSETDNWRIKVVLEPWAIRRPLS